MNTESMIKMKKILFPLLWFLLLTAVISVAEVVIWAINVVRFAEENILLTEDKILIL